MVKSPNPYLMSLLVQVLFNCLYFLSLNATDPHMMCCYLPDDVSGMIGSTKKVST